jgi:hypothetical protein
VDDTFRNAHAARNECDYNRNLFEENTVSHTPKCSSSKMQATSSPTEIVGSTAHDAELLSMHALLTMHAQTARSESNEGTRDCFKP